MWIEKEGFKRKEKFIHINDHLQNKKGFLNDEEFRANFIPFLRQNPGFAVDLLLGIELFEFQEIMLRAMFDKDFCMNILPRGGGKTFINSIFSIIYSVLYQPAKVGIFSANFRASRDILQAAFNTIKSKGAPLVNQAVTEVYGGDALSKRTDEYKLHIGQTEIRALPLGNDAAAQKLRGFRFNVLIVDEFLLIPENIYKEVLYPFTIVNPGDIKVRGETEELEKEMIRQGKMKEEDRVPFPNNKIIISSSASHKFQYMYNLYEETANKIRNPDFKKNNSSIIQISHEVIPQGMYNQDEVEKMRNSMSDHQFKRELCGQFTDDNEGFYRLSKIKACEVPIGEDPVTEIVGNKGDEYILCIDPAWSKKSTADAFAMMVFKLRKDGKTEIVHKYAVVGGDAEDSYFYFHYLYTHFNIIMVTGDYQHGLTFIDHINESQLFKEDGLKIDYFDLNFGKMKDEPEKVLSEARKSYDRQNNKICALLNLNDPILRGQINDILQADIDNQKIIFNAKPLYDSREIQKNIDIPIQKLKFMSPHLSKGLDYQDQDDSKIFDKGNKMADFLDHQSNLTETLFNELISVEQDTSSLGHRVFNLPKNIRNSKSPARTRDDLYTVLLYGNYARRIFEQIKSKPKNKGTFRPFFV